MAENIKKTPTDSGDKEEDPRIVAQRFLNIFHQLHIFGEEKRQVFNEMLLEQPPQVKSAFRQLPGGTILLDYLSEIENGNDDTQIDFDDDSDNVSKDTFENKKTENSNTFIL